jgi:hypothetical protein
LGAAAAAMNIEELRKNIGQLFRLHPVPVAVQGWLPEVGLLTSDGPKPKEHLVDADYDWRLENVTSEGVALRCLFTGTRLRFARSTSASTTSRICCCCGAG